MNDFIRMMNAIFQAFQLSFNIYGFTFTLWQVVCFGMVASIVAWFIGRLLAN